MKSLVVSLSVCLLLVACAPPADHGRNGIVYRSCQVCGDCKPYLQAIKCTMIGCDCCNRCIWTMRCANTGDEFPVAVDQCDKVIWIVKKSK